MSLQARTLLLVLVPLTGLVFFAGLGWVERSRALAEAEVVVERVDLLSTGGELIHFLQLERGWTAGWLATEDDGAPGPGMREARSRVDAAARAFRSHPSLAEVGSRGLQVPEGLRISVHLDSLPDVRREVDRRAASGAEAIAFYTRLNELLIRTLRGEAHQVGNPEVASHAAVYTRLLQLKELAGLERAFLYAVLTRGGFLPGERDALVGLVAQQEALRRELSVTVETPGLTFPSDLVREVADHPSSERAMEIREEVLREGPGTAGVEPGAWFDLQTERIDLLRSLEQGALEGLRGRAGEIRARMARERAAFASVALIIVILTLAGAALSARSVRRPLEEQYEALKRIGEDDGVREARLAERGPAETVAIARAFNAYAERLQELLRRVEESEARYSGILEISLDAIITVNEDHAIVLFNEGAEEMFGYRSEEVMGRPLEILLPRRHRQAHAAHIRHFAASPVRSRRMAQRGGIAGLRKSGEEFPAEASISKLRRGGEWLFTVVLQDVTEQRRVEEELARYAAELERSNQELEQFAYVASHDLQEPLRMVASYTQLLARRYRGQLDEDADEFIGFAVEGAERMRDLINDLLTYSRAGRQEREFGSVDLERVLDRTVSNLTVAIEEEGATVTRDPLPTVKGDESWLTQVFQNLISNAIRFRGAEAPRVHVAAARTNGSGEWRISVQDNGEGIAEEHLERIFLIFQRLHGRRESPGTGIGLSIAKRIVERHGGRIWVESEPGRGSTFHFTIPDVS